jgi:hypothetical protein
VVKQRGDREATDNNIIRHMGFACWITNTTDTHGNNVNANAPQYSVIRTLFVLFSGQYSIAFLESSSVNCQPPALAKTKISKFTKINS